MPKITKDRLCELLEIDVEKGIFIWKHTMGGKAKKGQEAGAIGKNGYLTIRIDQVDYLAHRLIFTEHSQLFVLTILIKIKLTTNIQIYVLQRKNKMVKINF